MKQPCENQREPMFSSNPQPSLPCPDNRYSDLRANCANCFGLCCVALYFFAADGFPADKEAGKPCPNLRADYRCKVHNRLREKGLKGCAAYDCLGAGQKVSQFTFGGHDWRQSPASAKSMFEAFLVMHQLHELLWYLTEAMILPQACSIRDKLGTMRKETERLTLLDAESLIHCNVASYRQKVNTLLLQTGKLVRASFFPGHSSACGKRKTPGPGADLCGTDLRRTDLRGANLRGAFLIAANLRGTDLSGADLIGADLRDANISGANLSKSIFLTQSQINVAKGDAGTKLPPSLLPPSHWPATKA